MHDSVQGIVQGYYITYIQNMSILLPPMLYLVYHNIAGKSGYIRGGRNETREHDTVELLTLLLVIKTLVEENKSEKALALMDEVISEIKKNS